MPPSLPARFSFCRAQPGFLLSAAWGALLMVCGLWSVLLVKAYVLPLPAAVPSLPDLILDRIPTVSTFGVAEWGPVIISCVFLVHLLWKPWYAPVICKAIGVLYFLRALFIAVTPLGMRSDQIATASTTFLQSISYSGNDFFFSGHVAFPFLLALIFWKSTTMRFVYLALALVMAVAVLLEHIHYSVDVLGAPFIVVVVWEGCKKWLRSDMAYVRAGNHLTGS